MNFPLLLSLISPAVLFLAALGAFPVLHSTLNYSRHLFLTLGIVLIYQYALDK